MATLPNLEVYPKTVLLRDGTKVQLRPLEPGDKLRLLRFFSRLPEAERYYLRDSVTAPELIESWTSDVDLELVIPILALVGDEIVADASLHRSRARSRRHIGEIRIVVAADFRERGLGRRLIQELVDIAAELELYKVTFELVTQEQGPAILAAKSLGFKEVSTGSGWVKDLWGNYQDLVLLELPLEGRDVWLRF